MAVELSESRQKCLNVQDILLSVDRFKFNSFIRVDSAASRAALVEIFFDMMPAETANLIPWFSTKTIKLRKR